jgi:hypothetical protein
MGKLKTCIVFAVSVFDESRIHVLHEFLSMFKQSFLDCKLYIGINYGSLPNTEQIIESYGLHTQIKRVHDVNMYTGSDASAYQAALALLKHDNRSHDIYWFAHTKGAVNDRNFERALYLNELFNKRNQIESLFLTHKHLGSYALRGVSRSAGSLNWATFNADHDIDICSNVLSNELPYSHVNWSYIETMYVINKNSMETFLTMTTDVFYNTPISEPCYFEIVLPWIVSRCGYFSYVHDPVCFFGERNLKDLTKDWIQLNNLNHLTNYLNL